jgi:hypothetical protein
MKSTVSIALLVLLLLNVMGYYGVFVGLQYKNNQQFNSSIESESYSVRESITIRVPLALPYHIDDQEFSKAEGLIQYQEEYYRLVRQKLVSDTLLIVCVRDHDEEEIAEALSDYVKTFADHPVTQNQRGKGSISFIKDFLPGAVNTSSSVSGWSNAISFASLSQSFQSRHITILTPPPQS